MDTSGTPPETTVLRGTSLGSPPRAPNPYVEPSDIERRDNSVQNADEPSRTSAAIARSHQREGSPPTPEISSVPLSSAEMIPDGFIGTSFIESYERSDKIGQGTFGEVTVAYHKVTGQKVALKRVILHKEKEGIPITTVREVQVLKLLHHKNIMSLHELTLEKGNAERIEPSRLYLVFPFMEHDLAGLLGNPAVLFEPQHIKSFARQILEGLAYIHKEHVLHRDLKTANILVDNRGNLRITDFGLARSYTERDYTLTPNVVTRWYRAPELIIGLKYYGTPVDMWGFACVFAELWDRRAVFRGDTEVQIMDKILTICGTPTKDDWPDFVSLTEQVNVKPKEHERKVRETWIPERFDYTTIEFIDSLFILNPATRPTAEQALEHAYFIMEPAPARPNTEDFAPWPSSHDLTVRAALRKQKEAGIVPGLQQHCDVHRTTSGLIVRRRRVDCEQLDQQRIREEEAKREARRKAQEKSHTPGRGSRKTRATADWSGKHTSKPRPNRTDMGQRWNTGNRNAARNGLAITPYPRPSQSDEGPLTGPTIPGTSVNGGRSAADKHPRHMPDNVRRGDDRRTSNDGSKDLQRGDRRTDMRSNVREDDVHRNLQGRGAERHHPYNVARGSNHAAEASGRHRESLRSTKEVGQRYPESSNVYAAETEERRGRGREVWRDPRNEGGPRPQDRRTMANTDRTADTRRNHEEMHRAFEHWDVRYEEDESGDGKSWRRKSAPVRR